MNQILNGVVVIATAIVGVAILSVLVSRNSNTAGVLTAGSQAFSNALGTAMGGGNSNFAGSFMPQSYSLA